MKASSFCKRCVFTLSLLRCFAGNPDNPGASQHLRFSNRVYQLGEASRVHITHRDHFQIIGTGIHYMKSGVFGQQLIRPPRGWLAADKDRDPMFANAVKQLGIRFAPSSVVSFGRLSGKLKLNGILP
jgi:hypothetical protein